MTHHLLSSVQRSLFLIAFVGAVSIFFSACSENAIIRGVVKDAAGETLPGVSVILEEQNREDLSNANGRYSLRAERGNGTLHFYKTGYSSVHLKLDALLFGVNEMPEVRLTSLPAEEGVFFQQNFRYQALEHPRINRYTTASGEPVFGTPVQPGLTLPWKDPGEEPQGNPPVFFAYKVQPYNALLHQLRSIALKQGEAVKDKKESKENGNQDTILVADKAIPLISRILDEEEGQTVELHPGEPLEPGIYAFHWGALSGYDSLDPRAFLFAIAEKLVEEGIEGESVEGE